MKERILVVDDDEKITNLLRRALSYEGYVTDIANDGAKALALALEHHPDLVVLDIQLPGMDGIEVCRRLREGGDEPILMLTARDEVSDRVRGLDSGADDYLVKPFALEELMARVRALLRRREPETRTELRFSDLVLDTASREARRSDRAIELSAKEYDLLSLFMRNPRRVLTREQILEQAWGYDFYGESNVIEVYVGYLRQKLETAGEPRLIHTVRGAGYVLKE
ncbi:MAG TPA: response regulator transcription factor [Chloroflexota bacterium]|jgi:two-component system response regulator MprA|nr:response regulator transcription factor [Chloroflexota bacterium]